MELLGELSKLCAYSIEKLRILAPSLKTPSWRKLAGYDEIAIGWYKEFFEEAGRIGKMLRQLYRS